MWAGIEGHLPSRSCQTSGVSALPERGEKRAWRLTNLLDYNKLSLSCWYHLSHLELQCINRSVVKPE